MGQGDVTSPSNWKAVFDILLRAIELSTIKGAFHFLESDKLHVQNAMAYVDDLISAVVTKEALQQISDIVCAFCAIFGMSMAPGKLRCSQLNYGSESSEEYQLNELNLRMGIDWRREQVPVKHDGEITYLGVKFDVITKNNYATVLEEVKET